MELSITASLKTKDNKFPFLNSVRIKIEVLKRFFRIAYELNIINQEKYINFEIDLQELSKMANGWIKYLK